MLVCLNDPCHKLLFFMKSLIVANWKMNPKSLREAKKLLEMVKKGLKKSNKNKVIICPSFLYIPLFKKQKSLEIGGQNCSSEEKGAFTGEVSPFQLKDMGCNYVILGHSERRKYFNESNKIINKKIKESLRANLIPIVCIGEDSKTKKEGGAISLIGFQIKECLFGIPKDEGMKVIFAYEPLWAIGSKKSCPLVDAQEMRINIQKILSKFFKKPSFRAKVLYGGSVNVNNASGYIKKAGLDGLLIGGASLDERFSKILMRV